MSKGFFIVKGGLISYRGKDKHVVIPDKVTEICTSAFNNCPEIASVVIPDSVTKIDQFAFSKLENLSSVTIPDSVTFIGDFVFASCKSLTEIELPDSLKRIGGGAFQNCTRLRSITIPNSVKAIALHTFRGCTGLTSVTLPEGLTDIYRGAFSGCSNLTTVFFPSDKLETLDPSAFESCDKMTIICKEDSAIHHYCARKKMRFIFDYQYEAFHGLLPQGFGMLTSPFLADEEKPYIFISYSHKDRDAVLKIIKTLYEKGWRIWYDEGLTIGDSYDKTLYEHVKDCSAFLLFITENSVKSNYIKLNEIPWALEFDKPVVKCIVDAGMDIEIDSDYVTATVSPSDIEPALEKVSGLTRGEPREAKGISVVADPANRDRAGDGGFAYCVYSSNNSSTAKAVMLSVRNGGCALYDAVDQGADKEKLRRCACLVVFLDKAFLSDKRLMKTLTDEYLAGKNIAVCKVETVTEDDLPQELRQLRKVHWLNFAHGINEDMIQRLTRHLEKRGCRSSSVIPGFDYQETGEGIVITRYLGMEPDVRIESSYNGKPVVEIARSAFESCFFVESVTVCDGITRIGVNLLREDGSVSGLGIGTFQGCTGLTSVTIPNSVKEIGKKAFSGCTALTSISLPDSLEEVGYNLFEGCTRLSRVVIPDGVKELRYSAFRGCMSLTSVTAPDSVVHIEKEVFKDCTGLTSVTVPDSVEYIGQEAFKGCTGLTSAVVPDCTIYAAAFAGCKGLADENGFVIIRGTLFSYYGNASSVIIPDSVDCIDCEAFKGCESMTSVVIPKSVTAIGAGAFRDCTNLTSVSIPNSIRSITDRLFCGCSSLSHVEIPFSVREIYDGAFQSCKSMTSFTIPSSVEYLGHSVFADCPNLTEVVVPGSVRKIELFIFDNSPKVTVYCSPDSYAWKYFKGRGIPVKNAAKLSHSGPLGKLFGKNRRS